MPHASEDNPLLDIAKTLAEEMKAPESYPCAVCSEEIPVTEAVYTRITSWHMHCNKAMKQYEDLITTDMLDGAAHTLWKQHNAGDLRFLDLPLHERIEYRRLAKEILISAYAERGLIDTSKGVEHVA